jgi:hypothetical protein
MTQARLLLMLFFYLCLLCACGGGTMTSAGTPTLAITSSNPPAGAALTPYAGDGFALTASGGQAPYHWSWVAATGFSLPAGLTISPEGLISGTPQAAGTYKVVVTVADSGSPSSRVSASYPIAVDGLPRLAISPGQPPSGTVGVEYGPSTTEYLSCVWSPVFGWHRVCIPCTSFAACSTLPRCGGGMSPIRCMQTEVIFLGFAFTASGGEPPYTWTASGLPDNLTLDPNTGQLSGKPALAGIYDVTVTVTDSQSPASQDTANDAIKIGTGTATP